MWNSRKGSPAPDRALLSRRQGALARDGRHRPRACDRQTHRSGARRTVGDRKPRPKRNDREGFPAGGEWSRHRRARKAAQSTAVLIEKLKTNRPPGLAPITLTITRLRRRPSNSA